MLVHYTIASYEVLQKKLTAEEREDIYDVFYRFGKRMKIKKLAADYNSWVIQRNEDLKNDLEKSSYTIDLFKQYKKHLGHIRYSILIEGQKLIVPERVRKLLGFRKISLLNFILPFYKLSKLINVDRFIKNLFLPSKYKKEIYQLDTE